MKNLSLFFLFVVTGFVASAQKSGSDTLTIKASIVGGDGTGRIVSYQWSGSGAGPITFDSPTQSRTVMHVTVVGNYQVIGKAIDNLGNVGTDTINLVAYLKQGVIVVGTASSPGIEIH